MQQRRYLLPLTGLPSMAGMSNRQGKITEENLREAAALLKLWNAAKDRLRESGLHTQEAFCQQFSIGNQAAVGFFLNGKTALSVKAAAGFARGLGCKVADFSPRLAKIIDTDGAAQDVWPLAPFLAPDEWKSLDPSLRAVGAGAALRAVREAQTMIRGGGQAQKPAAASFTPATPDVFERELIRFAEIVAEAVRKGAGVAIKQQAEVQLKKLAGLAGTSLPTLRRSLPAPLGAAPTP